MGQTQICNFQVTVYNSTEQAPMYGAMTLKEIKSAILSEIEYQTPKGIQVERATIFAQTKSGQRFLKGYDYAVIDPQLKVSYHYMGDHY